MMRFRKKKIILAAFAALILAWFSQGSASYSDNIEMLHYFHGASYMEPAQISSGLAIYRLGEGEPILLFPYPHAGTTSSMAENQLAEILQEMGRTVITFDPPGAYYSTREPHVDMTEMLEAALETLEIFGIDGPIDTAGHSMGGLAALAFAVEYPESVDRLILINTLSGFPASLEWGLPGSAWSWYEKEYWQLMYWGIRMKIGRGSLATHKKLMNLMTRASFHDQSWVVTYPIYPEDHRIDPPVRARWTDAVWNVDYAGRLSEVRAETWISAGSYDPQTPLPCAEELASGISQSRLVVFEESGHNPFIEERERFTNSLSEFLAGR
jgi:proline iminopeptidase